MNEAKNTMNILADKRLLVTSVWCRIGIHNWQKWSAPIICCVDGFTTDYKSIQERYCDNCHKRNVRETKYAKPYKY